MDIIMKDIITENITKQIQSALKSTNGASYTFGEPIEFSGKHIVPVAKVKIILSANSTGEGGGKIENTPKKDIFGAASMLGGGGGGEAGAGITIEVIPIGFIVEQNGNPIFNPI